MRYSYRNIDVLFKGKRVDVFSIESNHPKGGMVRKELVNHPGAVVVLPLLDENTVVMIRNERPIVQQTLWELPAGTLDEGEEPLACASRELIEETGYSAGKISHVIDFFSTPGFCNELLFTYLAQDLTYVGQKLDETEKIDVEAISLEQALNMIKKGVICDAKSICLLLYLAQYGRS